MRKHGLIEKSLYLVLSLSLALGLGMVGCAAPAEEGPARTEAEVIEWDWASMYTPAISTNYQQEKHFVDTINLLADGRLVITFYDAGEIIGPLEQFDAVGQRIIDAGGGWGGFWAGKNSAFPYLGDSPFLFSFADWMIWTEQAGGLEIARDLYGKYNLLYMPFGATLPESGFHTSTPIRTLADVKGMTLRTSSAATKYILEQLGAKVVNIAGPELYTAVEKGLVDGMEWNTPDNDFNMGFAEITDSWTQPHLGGQTGTALESTMNPDSFNELSENLQNIIEIA